MEDKRGRGALKGSHSKRRQPLEGKTFGNWHVISYYGMLDEKKSAYLCECTLCGNHKLVRSDKLMAGKSTMCMDCRRKQGGKKMKYKKGDKIVVEIAGEDNAVGKCYRLGDGKHLMVALSQDWVEDNAQPLSDYIEDSTYEAKREIRKLKAENKELKRDLKDLSSKSDLNIEAARSFAHYDAWGLARRIVLDEKSGGFSGEDYIKMFGSGISTEAVFKKYSYEDVADLVEKLEKERTEFDESDVYCDEIGYRLQEKLYDQIGDASEDWNLSTEQEKELSEILAKAVIEYINKNNLQPKCYKVVDIENVQAGEE